VQQAIYEAFVSIGWWEILVTMCNTLITFAIIKKFLFKPVRKMLAQREEEVKTIYSAAEQAQTEAEQKRTEYTERLSKAKEEAAEIVGSATRRATVRSEEILKESSQQAAAMMKKAETTIEQERKKAMNELKDEVASLSVMIASKVVERDVKEADHERFIEEFIDKVGCKRTLCAEPLRGRKGRKTGKGVSRGADRRLRRVPREPRFSQTAHHPLHRV